jgi:hypothetical protein
MPAFILVSSALLVFAVTTELLSLHYQPAALVALFSSLPLSEKIAWAVICLVPLSLIVAAVWQHCRLVEQRKARDVLETRLHGVRQDVVGLAQAQKENDRAAQYLVDSDPEDAISALQTRITHTEQVVQFQQQRNQSSNLIARVEEIRQQQQDIRANLGEAIENRRSIKALFTELESAQDDMEQAMSVIEEDRNGDTLECRVQKLSEFTRRTSSRCEEIESSMCSLLELKEKFDALQSRVAPLDEEETGIVGVLSALSDIRERVVATVARLEEDEGVPLAERIQRLFETKRQLEERVWGVVAQFSAIETIHKDITALFAKLNQVQRLPRELDTGGRIVAISG